VRGVRQLVKRRGLIRRGAGAAYSAATDARAPAGSTAATGAAEPRAAHDKKDDRDPCSGRALVRAGDESVEAHQRPVAADPAHLDFGPRMGREWAHPK
jgi:hypothetical protein